MLWTTFDVIFPFAPSPYQLLGFVLGTLLWIRAKAFWSEQRAVYRFRPAMGRLYNRFPWQSVPSDFVRDLVPRRQHTPSPASAALSRLQPPSVEGQGILDRAPSGAHVGVCLMFSEREKERKREREKERLQTGIHVFAVGEGRRYRSITGL